MTAARRRGDADIKHVQSHGNKPCGEDVCDIRHSY